jgi:hypothetical protein
MRCLYGAPSLALRLIMRCANIMRWQRYYYFYRMNLAAARVTLVSASPTTS